MDCTAAFQASHARALVTMTPEYPPAETMSAKREIFVRVVWRTGIETERYPAEAKATSYLSGSSPDGARSKITREFESLERRSSTDIKSVDATSSA